MSISALDVPRDQWPLCVTINEAAAYTGVGQKVMREWVNDKIDPVPHVEIGAEKRVYIDGIAPWLERTKVLRRELPMARRQ